MMDTTAWRRTIGAVVAVVALLVLSACGAAGGEEVASAGGTKTPAGPTTTGSTARLDADAQALAFAGCMRDNGVDMPDPGPGQQGLVDAFQAVAGSYDRATLRQALSACQDLMPRYAQAEQHDDEAMLALAECLRQQGLNVSDDPFNDAHQGEVDVNQFTKAMEVCREVLVRGGP